jgi:probable HAF family extracellular repeat protein
MLTKRGVIGVLAAVALLAAFSIRLTAKPKLGTQTKHQQYQVIVLPPDGGADSFEAGYLFYAPLTNLGTVGVAGDRSAPGFNSYTWTNGKQVDLQPLPQSPTLMGTATYINWINEFGFSAGYGTRFDSTTQSSLDHAALWTPGGHVFPLSTPQGYQSRAVWINDYGMVSGWIANSTVDPCSGFFSGTGFQTQGVAWVFGLTVPLGTLGGTNSYGEFVNNLGQVSGHSETSNVPDPNTGCPPFDPFIWGNGKMTDINPGNFGGPFGGTNFLNNQGDVVGYGATATGSNAFLWSRGRLTNLSKIGSLGNTSDGGLNVNELGHVVGVSATPTGAILGVLWRGQEFINLMSFTAYGEDCSQLVRINSRDQIVGESYNCETSTSHAALWENNELVDLNTLIPSDSGIMLTSANWINEHGVIAAQGVLTSGSNSGATRAVLLIPNGDCDEGRLVTSSSPAQESAKAQRSSPFYRTADGRVNPMFLRPFSVEMMRRKAQN